MLNSEVIGQRLNLTSGSFRAQSAAREVAAVPASFRRGRCLHRPVGPPRNDKGLGLSLRGAKRRGNPHPRPKGSLVQRELSPVGADAHIGPLLGTTSAAPVGRGDHTPPCWPVDRPGVPGKPGSFPPPFSFCRRQKENGGGAVKRKNAFRCAVTGAERPAAQRDAALNCSAQLR